MSSMFSSPQKQAQQAGQGSQDLANTDIAALERYTNSQEQNLRNAIPAGSTNPYLNAAQGLSPGQMPMMTPPGSITSISPNQIPASTGNPFRGSPGATLTGQTTPIGQRPTGAPPQPVQPTQFGPNG